MIETRTDALDFYIHATSTPADDRTRVLKDGETFAVLNRYGDIRPLGLGEQGLYHQGTRHLSRFVLTIDGGPPILLSSNVRADNLLLSVDLTNVDLREGDELRVPQDTLHLSRTGFLWQGTYYQRLRVTNFGDSEAKLNLGFVLDADFADIFEVRGMERKRYGERLDTLLSDTEMSLRYRGLDDVLRMTRVVCSPAPDRLIEGEIGYFVSLAPGESSTYEIQVLCDGQERETVNGFDAALESAQGGLSAARSREARVDTSNEHFNEWLHRSAADVRMLTTHTPQGPYPYAGVPWFSTAFGRDGIITALEMLWMNPSLAHGVLAYLAEHQATEVDPERDAEPGKILHETRLGEMAALKEHPFERYYGSVDSTPLFVVLAGEYYRATGDRAFIEDIWSNILAALDWIETYGDRDGDGFIEYSRSPVGLVQQGWKDSNDSVFHADGSPAPHPIALSEVQGYVYAAKLEAARMALALGDRDMAVRLRDEASDLQERFDGAFWNDELGMYALALDGDKRQCAVRTSNAGHCLWARIVPHERTHRLAAELLSSAMFSGWGVRTLASDAARYNPMSYHNGSVWPHDNALIAAGFARYGVKEPALRILEGTFATSYFLDMRRLPELFCGFDREYETAPILYPVACLPQAWAAGAVFMLLGACLGLEIDAPTRSVRIAQPVIPAFLETVTLEGIRVGSGSVDLCFDRDSAGVSVSVLNRDGDIDVIVSL